MIHHLAPIRRLKDRTERRRQMLLRDTPAAHRRDMERKTELRLDVRGVLRKDSDGPFPDVPKSDDAYIDWLHTMCRMM